MRAVVKEEAGPGAELVEVETPRPGPGEVLVKVEATSICGTDVHIYEWNDWARRRIKPPLIMGHEFAGRVVEVGEGVTQVAPGDYVSAETHIPCGQCYFCRTGRMHICENLQILGVDRDGCFAEYIVVPEIVLWKNPENVPPKLASIQEPLGNSIHVLQSADVAGRSVAIFGAGTTGLFATAIAHLMGAAEIFVVDQYEFKLGLAKRFGASKTINFRAADPVQVIREATDGLGAEVTLEMSGSPQAFRQALRATRKGGKVIAFGIPDKPVEFDLAEEVIFKELEIEGITGRLMFDTWYRMSQWLQSGRLDVGAVITHELPLAEFKRGFELLRDNPGETVKVVLYP